MATNTYVALATQTVSSPVSSVTFASLPQNYTDLRVVVSARGTTTAYVAPLIQFNSDTGSTNYSWTAMFGDGSSGISYRVANQNGISGEQITRSNDAFGLFGLVTFDIKNYSSSLTYKTILVRNASSGSSNVSYAGVGLWRATPAAINTIIISSGTPQFDSGSTFTIYGIAAEGNKIAPKATGGAIYSDANYYYHVFGSNGAFIPSQSLTADFMVVAGGGGGGFGAPGGSGGGGGSVSIVNNASLSSGTSYAAIIGAGGAGTSGGGNGTAGTASSFNSITSNGGGGGVGSHVGNGGNSSSYINGATLSYTGGAIVSIDNQRLSGGGGAGAGQNGGTGSAGGPGPVGGNGITSAVGNFTNEVRYYGGGGNGGTEGTGPNGGWGAYQYFVPTTKSLGGGGWGGGQITSNPAAKPTTGEAFTGGGGGGGTWDNSLPIVAGAGNGASGGSGVVIVRYAKA